MDTVSMRDVRLRLPRVLRQKAVCLVVRRGKPVAGIIPLKDADAVEDFILANSPRIRRRLEEADRDSASGRTAPFRDIIARKRA